MLRSMTARDFDMWIAYYQLEPSLDQRIDTLIASVTQMIHNVAMKQGNQKPLKDFVLAWGEDRPTTTWQQQKTMMMSIIDVHNHLVDAKQREQ